MSPIRPLLCLALWALPLAAQNQFRTAHPQAQPHINTGQMVPLSNHFNSASGRSQMLIEARLLPGPGAVLVGVEAFGLSAGKVHYRSLEIRVSPVAPSAIRSALFANNMPRPTTVFARQNFDLSWNTQAWQSFPAGGGYVHDGVSDLTLEFQKDCDAGSGDGGATGLYIQGSPTMYVEFGKAGSGAHKSTLARIGVIPIDVRLVWEKVPTLQLESPIPQALHHGFALGSHLDVHVEGETGSLVAVIVDGLRRPGLQVPGIAGLLRVDGIRLPFPTVLLQQRASLRLQIPRLASLDGGLLVFQGAAVFPSRAQLLLTNTAECLLSK